MRQLVLVTALVASFAVQAQSLCDSTAKGLKCHEVVSPLPTAELRGSCTGTFLDLPCRVTYFSRATGAGMFLTCGKDPLKPDLQQFLPTAATTFSVSAIVTGTDGVQRVVHEGKVNTTYESEVVLLKIAVAGEERSGSFQIAQASGFEELKDVQCK